MSFDSPRFEAAAARFKQFFEELGTAFVEREDVLAQVALGLISKEHVLVAGPPGTAKSLIASSVFGRIVCEESGKPSLYARQITESTVQTDLIGPIDFKNLMETGRTTHFTDEGMLGAAHAFLDEVFDGRDMLLRSALNVLQERELKQGSTVTRGRIECALMTSNRYISDVLDQSRETLLAFVDRIAFVGFVPRGFAEPSNLGTVLKRTVMGRGRPRLDALLTIQDLDVVQAAAADVHVAPEVCNALARLLDDLDHELAAASKADPAFSPTRYISTRTAVRCGNILRAIATYDRIFRVSGRRPEVLPRDLPQLRLHLLLSGPSPAEIEKLLAREVDPVERRQLSIMRTEREIFDACLAKMPVFDVSPPSRPSSQPPPPSRSAAPAAAAMGAAQGVAADPERDKHGARERISKQIEEAAAARDHASLVALVRNLTEGAREGAPEAAAARELLARATGALRGVSLQVALSAADPSVDPLEVVRSLAALAGSLDDGSAAMHPTASWIEAQALALVDELAPVVGGSAFQADGGWGDVERRVAALENLAWVRTGLLARTALSAADVAETWGEALDAVEEEIAAALSRSFSAEIATALELGSGASLAGVLGVLSPELGKLDAIDAKFSAVAGRPASIKRRVAGPRVGELARAALLRGKHTDRRALFEHIRELWSLLRDHGLGASLRVEDWLGWTAEALVAGEGGGRCKEAPPPAPTRDGYLALRSKEQRTSVVCLLAEVALLVGGGDPEAAAPEAIAAKIEALAAEQRGVVAALDLARIDRAVSYLEAWWSAVDKLTFGDLAASGIYGVLWDDAALARFSLEARLLEQLLPSAAEEARAMRKRVSALADRARSRGVSLLEARAAETWKRAAAAS